MASAGGRGGASVPDRGQLDKDDVLAALSVESVLDFYAVEVDHRGRWLRGRTCPGCGEHKRGREAFAVEVEAGRFKCHKCGAGGDLLDLVALCEGLDPRRDFPRVVEMAAQIAGVSAPLPDAERERRREERRVAAEARRRAEAQRRADAEARAPGVWESLRRDDARGRAYLRSRMLETVAGEVRYTERSVCLRLRQLDGRVTNIVGRRFDGAEPKIRGISGCRTFGTFGDLRKLAATSGPIVLVEGFGDYLSGRVLWPERLIIGAHGAGNLPGLAEGLAPSCIERGLVIVPHLDDVGLRRSDEAIASLVRGGVRADQVEILDVGTVVGATDLNDYLRGQS